jgi:hypothetical protein
MDRFLDQRLTRLFEQLEAIDEDPTLGRDLEADKPVPIGLYEWMLEAMGYRGSRPTLTQAVDWMVRELRLIQRLNREADERGDDDEGGR